jgi:methylated-DNA-[protein]-cysteine S-methyltransferase
MDMASGIHFAVFATAAGWCGVAGAAAGLRLTVLPQPDLRDVEVQIRQACPGAILTPEYFTDFMRRFEAYFEGRAVDFPDTLDLSGATGFQREVWQAARLIPRGQTRSYAWLAGRVGRPLAARAVGQALGENPLPVVVPCHRVLAADGGLGGFSGGLGMKRLLLDLEAAKEVISN